MRKDSHRNPGSPDNLINPGSDICRNISARKRILKELPGFFKINYWQKRPFSVILIQCQKKHSQKSRQSR
ncbi:MAG: hypothetical protein ABRQ38_04950 [Candidatus Eremiobacterota bacterium]